MRDKLSKDEIMSKYSHEQQQQESKNNAYLLQDVAEAIVLGYPVIVIIGEVPGGERETEVLTSSHFDGLDRKLQTAFLNSAIVELRNTV
jgi:hypothetical protein